MSGQGSAVSYLSDILPFAKQW